MSSINWGGLHGKARSYKRDRTRGQNLLKHCDQDFRQNLNRMHENKDLDPSKSYLNQNFTGLTYEQSRAKWQKRLDEIESDMEKRSGRKVRSDCVELTSLEMPVPAGMTNEQARQFFKDFYDICVKRFGEENIISANSHFDEIHEYRDAADGEIKISRPHIHIQIMPISDGRLCNKEFSSLKNIKELDAEVDRLCREKYHVRFHTGERLKKKDVERLKAESHFVEDQQKKIEEMEIKIGEMIDYLGNIHIKDNVTALDDFNIGGNGTAVNKAVSERSSRELDKKKEETVELTMRLDSMKQQLHEIQEQLRIYQEREKKIKRGIEMSDDPVAVRDGLNNALETLYRNGEEALEKEAEEKTDIGTEIIQK